MGQTSVLVIASALGLAVAGFAAVLFQVLRQQGRLLLRLDAVEKHLGLDAGESIDRGTVSLQARSLAGLPVGTALPDFRLPTLDGKSVSLEELRGRRVLLVHWSARCSYCERIAPDLAQLEPALEKAGVQMLFLGLTAAEKAERALAEEHGIRSPILLQAEVDRIEAFARLGTPTAYLLDEQGRVARPLAVGADQVLELADSLVLREPKRSHLPGERPLSKSRIEREGLKAGVLAPAFSLPDVRGGTVSLEKYRGRKVLLVFSDPHCGPCDELAPHLVDLHEQHRNNGLDLVLVGRGDPETNRSKAEQHGFEFPVIVQKRWELSRRYGIFATPVGFLINEDGVIEKGVAKGIDEILALTPPQAPRAGKDVVHGRVAG